MKDIKIKKVSPVKKAENTVAPAKKKYSVFSIFTFGLMSSSLICYIFLISSSIFYAIQGNKFENKIQTVEETFTQSLNTKSFGIKVSSDRISYINKDSDTSISLK